ncbi:MAG TPA: hypothetical protein VI643_04360 [Planctomycetota bacterium]|nr:hypothetical protein [Planctomycetota bacterium]
MARWAATAVMVALAILSACGRTPPPKHPKPTPTQAEATPQPPPPNPVRAPDGAIRALDISMMFEFQPARLADGRDVLRLTLPVSNPNPHPIRITAVTYSLRVGTRTLAEGHSIRNEVLEPDGHAILHLDHDASGWLYVLESLTKAETRFIEGRLYVSDPLPAGVARRDDFYFEAIGTPR